ncbi:MAG TPA: hypothetical protein VIV12_02010 [Streptosporangiaceae bacterium]
MIDNLSALVGNALRSATRLFRALLRALPGLLEDVFAIAGVEAGAPCLCQKPCGALIKQPDGTRLPCRPDVRYPRPAVFPAMKDMPD